MQTHSGGSSPLAGKRVLIAEDEGLMQMHLSRLLRNEGFQIVGQALNGQQAIDLALREQPDIILMDINMPVMNGLDAAEQIMTRLSPCLVFITAYCDEEFVQKAQALGAIGFLNKPVTTEILIPLLMQGCTERGEAL